jgi:alanyl-tRNA synthetase
LHAALRQVLGDHVHQAGSLVAPDRLRFDFTHHGPVKPEQLDEIEALANRWVWSAVGVQTEQLSYASAIAKGATALFGEKYGDVVRVVTVPGFSMELCGGTHVRNTSAIGLVRIVSETGVAAGVRRIEAATGARAFELMRARERTLARIAEAMKATPETVERRLTAVLEERRTLERKLGQTRQGGSADQVEALISGAERVNGTRVVVGDVQVGDAKELQALGDVLRERLQSGIAVLSATMEDGKGTLLVIITDDLREKGMRADTLVRAVAAIAGGKGGGKPHMAQAGIPDASRLPAAMAEAPAIARAELERAR